MKFESMGALKKKGGMLLNVQEEYDEQVCYKSRPHLQPLNKSAIFEILNIR